MYLMVGLLDFILVLLQLGGISLLQRLLRQLLFMLLQKPVELLTEKKNIMQQISWKDAC